MMGRPDASASRATAAPSDLSAVPVEVREVPAGGGTELGEVEVGVPADERVERPADTGDAALEGPRALVGLEGEADVAAGCLHGDSGDAELPRRERREEPDTGAHEGLTAVRARAVVAVCASACGIITLTAGLSGFSCQKRRVEPVEPARPAELGEAPYLTDPHTRTALRRRGRLPRPRGARWHVGRAAIGEFGYALLIDVRRGRGFVPA